MKNKKGFTLIELIAVLVILAILALIVTPLVMSIIKKARISADRRSIDVYGRSVELAIANYLLDNGDFPTEVSQLTIEYSGDEVVCSTTQLKSDSSIYLAGCTVGGRSVEGYTYGKGGEEEPTPTYTAYQVGDQVIYNNVDYYVIKDSSASEKTVTLLKAEPLSYEEVQTYSNGTGTQTSDQNGYGGMQYHSSSSAYETSYVKTTVNAWKTNQAPAESEARLITIDEVSGLGYEWRQSCPTCDNYWAKTEDTPNWIYNSNYWYWTMSPSETAVYSVNNEGALGTTGIIYGYGPNSFPVVRPVIVLPKSAL